MPMFETHMARRSTERKPIGKSRLRKNGFLSEESRNRSKDDRESDPGSITDKRLTVSDRSNRVIHHSVFRKGKCVCTCGHSHLRQLASMLT